LPEALWPLWERMRGYGAFENQAGVMAHRPPIFGNTWAMLTELAEGGALPKRYLELCLVTVSRLNKCPYCVSHHAPKLAVAGISEAGAAGLLDYKSHPELDEGDKLVGGDAVAGTHRWDPTPDDARKGGANRGADLAHGAVRRLQPLQRHPAARHRGRRRGARGGRMTV